MKIQNYGDWKGDKRGGHHPPACTCYRCNEQRRAEDAAQEEARRVAEYDRRVAESRERAQPKTRKMPTRGEPGKPPANLALPHAGSTEIARLHPESCPCGICATDRKVEEVRRRQASASSAPRSGQQPSRKPQTHSQQQAAEAVQRSKPDTRPAARTRPSPPSPRPQRQETNLYRLSRSVTASALRYALALHAAAAAGLVVYALAQGGASSVLPTLDSAADAYIYAWLSMGSMAGLG